MQFPESGADESELRIQTAWFAVYTKHQHERKSAELLERKGFEVFLPLYKSVAQWTDRRKTLLQPLFPSYVFLRTTMESKAEIVRTPGVFFLVESAGHACRIPELEIESIRTLIRSKAHLAPHPYLERGDRVRILAGPLAGLVGILTRVKNQYRVVLSVEALRKGVSVEIDIASVERLAAVPSLS